MENMRNPLLRLSYPPAPIQMELSGTGVTAKRVEDSVELTWGTGDETNNKGFIISRRKAKTEEWEEIASYQTWPPLNSKG